jgi:hypothetical protein
MKDSLLRNNKKGVSLMIGYVILISLAIGLSLGVFYYLKLYLPTEEPKCPSDVSLSVDEVNCVSIGSNYNVDINISNRGLFNVDSAFIKIGDRNRVFKENLNNANNRWDGSDLCDNGLVLKPGEKYCGTFEYKPGNSIISSQELSVEPIIWIDNKQVICTNAVLKKNIECV